jgi:hypothetical protein
VSVETAEKAADPAVELVVGGEPNATALVVPGLLEAQVALRRWTGFDRHDKQCVWIVHVDGDDLSAPDIALTARPVIGAARVELNAAVSDSSRLDLDPDDVATRRHDGSEVEGTPLTEREQDRDVRAGERSEYGGFGSVSSIDCLHTAKLHPGLDEHMFASSDR